MASNKKWYKRNKSDAVWWLDNSDDVEGEFVISFDRKTEYNIFADRDKMTAKQLSLFYKENPFWREFFEGE